MIQITEEQKQLLKEAANKKDFYKLKILESYIVKLLELSLPKKFILELIKKETNINVNYYNFLHFVNKHLKKTEKKEREIETEKEAKQQKTDLLEKLNLQIKNYE